jgi:hypothetical protein
MTPKFRVFKRATMPQDNALVCDIAARCADTVRRYIRCDTATMEAAEFRGYIRARALPIVRTLVQQSLAAPSQSSAQQDKLIAMTLERTVQLLVRDLQSPLVIAIPLPHVPTRAAA